MIPNIPGSDLLTRSPEWPRSTARYNPQTKQKRKRKDWGRRMSLLTEHSICCSRLRFSPGHPELELDVALSVAACGPQQENKIISQQNKKKVIPTHPYTFKQNESI